MRSRLLHSFLFVLGFWWIAAALYWSVSGPEINHTALLRVVGLFPWVTAQLPEYVNVLEAWSIQKQVLSFWSVPVIVVTLVSATIGALLVWGFAWLRDRERDERIKSTGDYRGVSLSLGPLPVPQTPPLQPVALRATDDSLKRLTEEQLAVLRDVLGLLAANREAFAGEPQPPGSLLSRTAKATYAALRDPQHPGLLAIATAASELGKLTAWKKDEEGAWIPVRNEERESARLLAALPSWWNLPETERLAVLYAVKYRRRVDLLPESPKNPAVYRLPRSLLDRLIQETKPAAPVATDQSAVPASQAAPASIVPPSDLPRAKAYEQRDPEIELFEVFEREVAMLPFQTLGLPKNIPAVGWKKGNRAYLLENRLTESLMPKLRPELQVAYAPSREKVRVEPLTAALLKLFHKKGWLVLEHGSTKIPPHEGLWVIQAGKLEFSRVIVLELPEEILARLPPKDSYYEVTIKRPLFQSPFAGTISKDDLLGSMLRPKSPTPKPAPTESKPSASTGDVPSTDGKPAPGENKSAAGGCRSAAGESEPTGSERESFESENKSAAGEGKAASSEGVPATASPQ